MPKVSKLAVDNQLSQASRRVGHSDFKIETQATSRCHPHRSLPKTVDGLCLSALINSASALCVVNGLNLRLAKLTAASLACAQRLQTQVAIRLPIAACFSDREGMSFFANLSDNAKGALFMMCSMAAFTFNDLFIKAIGTDVPLPQMLLLRGILACVMIYILARYLNALAWPERAKDRWLIVLRSGAEVAAAYFFLTALLHMPFANVTAILQTLPLTVTLAAALVFKEAVGWRRMLAIVIGFCGMMLIVRPGTEGFTIHSIYVLIAVVCVTVRDLAARRLSKEVPSLTVTLVGAIFVTVFGGVGAVVTGEWTDMTSTQIAMLIASAIFVIGGYVFSVMVMRIGEVGFTSPFRYTAMLWALLLGYVFFDEWPEPLTFIGAGLIVATGIFTLYRESRAKKRQAKTARI